MTFRNAVQRVGQSVWGHGYKAFVSGNASRSALEQAALSRNDGLLSISGENHASNARNLIPLTRARCADAEHEQAFVVAEIRSACS